MKRYRGGKNMDKYPLLRKGLVVGIILFIIVVTVSPSINTSIVKASDDNETITITTWILGESLSQIYKKSLLKSTTTEVTDLLQTIERRMNTINTIQEAHFVLTDAFIHLRWYGLIQKETNEDLIQGQLTRATQSKTPSSQFQGNNSAIYNRFCFFSLNATRINFDNIYIRISLVLSRIGYRLHREELQNLSMRFNLYGQYKPVHLMNRIVLSGPFSISTVGLLGKKSGTFDADLMNTKSILGFTGIKISSPELENQYIFGYARRIMIPT
jgi:hypothetical protein